MPSATKQTRVLQVITRLIVGGAQETVLAMAQHLDRSQFVVDVASGPETGQEGSLHAEVHETAAHLTVIPPLIRRISPPRDLAALTQLVAHMRRGRYDIVHTHSSKAGVLGRLAARWAGVPWVVHTVHGWSFSPPLSSLSRRAFVHLERALARQTDALLVVSRADRNVGLTRSIGRPEQYHLIRSGIDSEQFVPSAATRTDVRQQLGIAPDALVLGWLGRLCEQKDPLAWLRIAARIANATPRCRFLIVGDGPLRGQLMARLRQQNLAERAVWVGLQRDIAGLLPAMDLLLVTSRWEGLPRTVMQALATHVPVVAANVNGMADAVVHGQTGFLFPPGNVACGVAYCQRLLSDADLRSALGKNGRALIRRELDQIQMIAQTEALYRQLLTHPGPNARPS